MSGHEDALIVRYVEENPRRPGPADARLKDWGIELWALLSYLDRAVAGNVAKPRRTTRSRWRRWRPPAPTTAATVSPSTPGSPSARPSSGDGRLAR